MGYVSATPTTLAKLLGAEDLTGFTELSVEHFDGWGMAWATEGGVSVAKAPDPARTSAEFARMAAEHLSDAGFVHLRQATPGLSVRPENTHPFTDGKVAFGHNGRVVPAASLNHLVPPALLASMAGDTDSERYYLAVQARLAELGAAGALAATVGAISAGHEYTCLNSMFLTPDALYAVCQFDPAAAAERQEPDYFRLRYRVTDGAVVVASTGWGSGWESLGNGELLAIRRHTLEVSVRSISGSVLAS
ncbi:MAG TPA: class II glutamine amidotransferase [Streptosporangiaceae bacterium]|jgi:predicted glutamine amidotransferase